MPRLIRLLPVSLGLAALLGLGACDPAPESQQGAGSQSSQSDGPTTANGKYGVGDRLEPANSEGSGTVSLRTLEWDELIPADYDPMVILEGVDLDKMEDGDPRAQELLDELKEAWSNAPPVDELNGKQVRIPGFAVPLEGDETHVTEMLLVPYFGACIHVPPPPSNQIVHVFPQSPVDQETLYDAVWIEGTIKVERSNTKSGDAGYTFTATTITPYE